MRLQVVVLIVVSSVLAAGADGATLILRDGFEQGAMNDSTFTGSADVEMCTTTNRPHSGNYCVRMNTKVWDYPDLWTSGFDLGDRVDHEDGHCSDIDLGAAVWTFPDPGRIDMTRYTYGDTLYFRWWMRIDACEYFGNPSNPSAAPEDWYFSYNVGKLLYILGEDQDGDGLSVTPGYMRMPHPDRTDGHNWSLSPNGWQNTWSTAHREDDNYGKCYFEDIGYSEFGTWDLFEFIWVVGDGGGDDGVPCYMQFWYNGIMLEPDDDSVNSIVDGWIPWHPDLVIHGFQGVYHQSSDATYQTAWSRDGVDGEEAIGVQYDDFELWYGVPSHASPYASLPPQPPSWVEIHAEASP